jgi:hypothetical protein
VYTLAAGGRRGRPSARCRRLLTPVAIAAWVRKALHPAGVLAGLWEGLARWQGNDLLLPTFWPDRSGRFVDGLAGRRVAAAGAQHRWPCCCRAMHWASQRVAGADHAGGVHAASAVTCWPR